MLDTDSSHTQLQPDNAIILPKWTGAPKDTGLIGLIPFLEYVATMGIADIPAVVRGFEGKDIAIEFARREAIAREKFEKQMAEEKQRRPRSAPSFLASMLGLKPQKQPDSLEASAAEAYESGKMLQDQARERGQKHYENLRKELTEKGDEWLAELAAEEKKMQDEAMKSMKTSLFGVFGGPPPPQTAESANASEK
jgi:import inner membrane translocase subunit TIM50